MIFMIQLKEFASYPDHKPDEIRNHELLALELAMEAARNALDPVVSEKLPDFPYTERQFFALHQQLGKAQAAVFELESEDEAMRLLGELPSAELRGILGKAKESVELNDKMMAKRWLDELSSRQSWWQDVVVFNSDVLVSINKGIEEVKEKIKGN